MTWFERSAWALEALYLRAVALQKRLSKKEPCISGLVLMVLVAALLQLAVMSYFGWKVLLVSLLVLAIQAVLVLFGLALFFGSAL